MINYPKTLEEARAYRYYQWGGNPKGRQYIELHCAYELYLKSPGSGPGFLQCSRKNGRGPAGLYCWQHAKRVEGE